MAPRVYDAAVLNACTTLTVCALCVIHQSSLGRAYLLAVDADSRSATDVTTQVARRTDRARSTTSQRVLSLVPLVPFRVPPLLMSEPPHALNSDSSSGVAKLTVQERHHAEAAFHSLVADPTAIHAAPANKPKPLLHNLLAPIAPNSSLHVRVAVEGHHTQLRRGGVLRFVYGVVGGDATDTAAELVHTLGAGAQVYYTASREGMVDLREAPTTAPLGELRPDSDGDGSGTQLTHPETERQARRSFRRGSRSPAHHTKAVSGTGRHSPGAVDDRQRAARFRRIESGDLPPPLVASTMLTDATVPHNGALELQYSTDVYVRAQFVRPVSVRPSSLDFGNVPLHLAGSHGQDATTTAASGLATPRQRGGGAGGSVVGAVRGDSSSDGDTTDGDDGNAGDEEKERVAITVRWPGDMVVAWCHGLLTCGSLCVCACVHV